MTDPAPAKPPVNSLRGLLPFLRPHLPDAIVLGINELPQSRRVEVVASIGGQSQLPFRRET